ncbi:hypothetical protein HanHA300_Chr17g0658471 [Helianthus annuus]|nr:hypothetical protein HanHA300_Chr17g0658471 [Helianthus annuus]KAJ0447921.1 hypothetical protein HanHA89_Chr17g0710861 [Helianthus annuus]KAJ0807569.1 hypothetical protein HanLR1_Chr00c1172g0792941 [Helianthus annuus]
MPSVVIHELYGMGHEDAGYLQCSRGVGANRTGNQRGCEEESCCNRSFVSIYSRGTNVANRKSQNGKGDVRCYHNPSFGCGTVANPDPYPRSGCSETQSKWYHCLLIWQRNLNIRTVVRKYILSELKHQNFIINKWDRTQVSITIHL